VDTILEIYFKKRVLMSGNREKTRLSKKMRELSAGEKREALINLIYVFLKEEEERDQIVIIGIDEPENSLHTALCYDQFEKLKQISKNAQVLITTHWYGFLPIIDKGTVHFLKNEAEERVNFFEKADLYLYPYRTKNIPEDFALKSTNDLVQSIFHSLKTKNPYNWLICEGSSDKIYLENFLKKEVKENNLRIIPVGGIELVKKFYKYLLLPISEHVNNLGRGRVFCLTDTDANLRKNDISSQDDKFKNTLVIKRLTNEGNNSPSLIKFEAEQKQDSIDVEKSLNPTIFAKTLRNLSAADKFLIKEENIQVIKGSTTKDNLRNFDIDNYFGDEDEVKKILFAKEYVSLMAKENNPEEYIPNWVTEIREFFACGELVHK
jgi:predicted ATP-dependent endonuclease of OLD family